MMFKAIKEFLKNRSEGKKVLAPEGVCPNCWGRQEYGGQFFHAMKDAGIGTHNVVEKKGWIQGYAEKNLLGISLQSHENSLECQKCNTRYSPEPQLDQ